MNAVLFLVSKEVTVRETSKPGKLKDFTGKFPSEDTIQKTYKLEPRLSPEDEAENEEKKRLYTLNMAMSKIPLESWDAWISHLVEYDFWPPIISPSWGHYCLFCEATNLNCYLCSGGGPIECAKHESSEYPYLKPGQTPYSRMVEVGIEKIQAHADWLSTKRNGNENTKV